MLQFIYKEYPLITVFWAFFYGVFFKENILLVEILVFILKVTSRNINESAGVKMLKINY